MIVCHCHAVSDAEIRACAERGATDVAAVAAACRAGGDCQGCHPRIAAVLAAESATELAGPRRRRPALAAG